MISVLYICNKQKSCSASSRCGVECKHTWDPKYALYGKCDYPWDCPDRFKSVVEAVDGPTYIEQERVSENAVP